MASKSGNPASRFSVDLLVLGSGMAGMTAAAQAAQSGLSVLVAEKASTTGGSAGISRGYIWTTPTLEALQSEDPDVDSVLVSVLADDFLPAVEWVKELGVDVGDRITGIYRFGHGFQIEIQDFLDRCRSTLEQAGGQILTGVSARELILDDGRVVGAEMIDREGATVMVEAKETVLATGGFQGSPELRAERIAPEARNILLRSNPTSEGDGLRLGEAAGADFVDGRSGFYGHLMPYPLSSFEEPDFISVAMLHSGYCLLFSKTGERFTDESLGDHENNQKVLRAPDARALLIADDHIRRERIATPYIPGMDGYDKFALASQKGAHVVTDALTFDELVAGVAGWGYDADRVKASLEEYNRIARDTPEDLSPPSTRHCRPMDVAPFFAMEVQPAITFSYGGIRVDATSRVVGKGGPIAGLLAAGVDIGGVYTRAYAGGLARGLVFGRRAALTAAGKEQ
jgi:succinate dehydrogenase/fumarate reductase flavoprotein subunit